MATYSVGRKSIGPLMDRCSMLHLVTMFDLLPASVRHDVRLWASWYNRYTGSVLEFGRRMGFADDASLSSFSVLSSGTEENTNLGNMEVVGRHLVDDSVSLDGLSSKPDDIGKALSSLATGEVFVSGQKTETFFCNLSASRAWVDRHSGILENGLSETENAVIMTMIHDLDALTGYYVSSWERDETKRLAGVLVPSVWSVTGDRHAIANCLGMANRGDYKVTYAMFRRVGLEYVKAAAYLSWRMGYVITPRDLQEVLWIFRKAIIAGEWQTAPEWAGEMLDLVPFGWEDKSESIPNWYVSA